MAILQKSVKSSNRFPSKIGFLPKNKEKINISKVNGKLSAILCIIFAERNSSLGAETFISINYSDLNAEIPLRLY